MTSFSELLQKPSDAKCLFVLAHGAGAGMQHPFLTETTDLLAAKRIATYRYEFPYMAGGKGRPDPPHLLQKTVRTAVDRARDKAPDLPIIAGGKSLGGRMTSSAAAVEPLPGVRGIAFLGFPLHAPGRDGDKRAEHLFEIDIPLLFIQGTRDSLANLDLIKAVCKRLGKRATLHIIDGGDHSFKVLKRSGRDQSEVMGEIAQAISMWTDNIL